MTREELSLEYIKRVDEALVAQRLLQLLALVPADKKAQATQTLKDDLVAVWQGFKDKNDDVIGSANDSKNMSDIKIAEIENLED